MTARLLLDHQLRAIDEVSWSVVSGDPFDDPPRDVSVRGRAHPPGVRLFRRRRLRRLWRCFRRGRFDFVQTHTPKASFLGLPAARLSGTTAIYTIHGALYFRDNSRAANVLGWLFETWCCTWAHVVLVQSTEDQRRPAPGPHLPRPARSATSATGSCSIISPRPVGTTGVGADSARPCSW